MNGVCKMSDRMTDKVHVVGYYKYIGVNNLIKKYVFVGNYFSKPPLDRCLRNLEIMKLIPNELINIEHISYDEYNNRNNILGNEKGCKRWKK